VELVSIEWMRPIHVVIASVRFVIPVLRPESAPAAAKPPTTMDVRTKREENNFISIIKESVEDEGTV
jgi:hypothetical protein